MTPLRVWLCTSTFLPIVGGSEVGALALARRLRARGVDATILTFRHHPDSSALDRIDGVPVVRVAGALLARREGLPRSVRRALWALASFRMAWYLCRMRERYDVLHLLQLSPLAGPVGLACWAASRPLAVTLAGIPSDLESVRQPGAAFSRLVRWMLVRARAVFLATSMRGMRSLAEHGFLLPGSRLIPAPGVDIDRFGVIDERTFAARAGTVVCVAQFRYAKGLDVLLHAWRLVSDQRPDARLIVVGGTSTEPDVPTALTGLVTELDLSRSVEFTGIRSDVPAQLHRGAISVLSSRSEGLPNALLEAMSCGLACVATRVSGSEDLIEHEVNGLLVEVEDAGGTARALLRLLDDPELARRYGKAARQTIERGYTADHVLESYVDVYDTLARRQWARHASGAAGTPGA